MKNQTKSTEPNIQTTMQERSGSIFRRILTLTLLSSIFISSGCASIVSGTHQKVKITSTPDAADVKVEQLVGASNMLEWQGKTPATVKLSRNGSYLVTVSLDGYKMEQIPLSGTGMNGWIWGNIIVGGLVGVIIDSADGAVKQLEPGSIDVKLVTLKTSQAGYPSGAYAVVTAAAPDGRIASRALLLKPVGGGN